MASDSNTPAKVIKIQRFQIGLNVVIQILVVCALMVMLNYLSFRHFNRWDLSRDQKYSLSTQTRSLLGSLEKPVRAVIFFSSAAEVAPDVSALVREYEFASKGKFNTEIVDPYKNITRATELAAKYKIRENDNILILEYDGRNKFVNAADMADFEPPDQLEAMMGRGQPRLKGFKGEQAITSALLELTEGKPNKVYYVTGHGEEDLKADELKGFTELAKRQNIEIAPLALLNASSVPDDARTVIVNGAKYDLSELELRLLADFWDLRKGRLLVLLNPYVKTPRLTEWLRTQGVTVQDDRVIRTGTFLAMDENGTPQVRTGTVGEAVFTIQDSGTSITPRDLVNVSKKLLGVTESLDIDRTKETMTKTRFLPLLLSAEGFWGEVDPIVEDQNRPAYFDPQKDHIGPLNLAIAAEKGGLADPRVKVETSRLIVVGNAEMLTNKASRLSEGITQDFAVNALNWLLDREQLAGIPPREKRNVELTLNEGQLRNLAFAVLAVPIFVALLGVMNWWQRRT